MNRELNSKEEMQKRLAYVVYVGCCCGGFLLGLRGFMTERANEILVAFVLVGVAVLLRDIGRKHWEFARLGRSFPLGSPAERLTSRHKKKLVFLLRSFHESRDWTVRMEIRKRLEELVRSEPLLLDAYRKDLREVHPNILAESQN